MPTGTACRQMFGEDFAQPFGQMVAAHRNAGQDHFQTVFIALGNFVRNAGERALHRGGIENDGGFSHKPESRN